MQICPATDLPALAQAGAGRSSSGGVLHDPPLPDALRLTGNETDGVSTERSIRRFRKKCTPHRKRPFAGMRGQKSGNRQEKGLRDLMQGPLKVGCRGMATRAKGRFRRRIKGVGRSRGWDAKVKLS